LLAQVPVAERRSRAIDTHDQTGVRAVTAASRAPPPAAAMTTVQVWSARVKSRKAGSPA
jgi:hypothetical protein